MKKLASATNRITRKEKEQKPILATINEDELEDPELDESDEDELEDPELDESDEDEFEDPELDESDEDESDDEQQTSSNGKKPEKATIDNWKASLNDSKLSIKDLYTPKAMKHNKRTSAAGLITIVYAKKTGSRLVLSTELTERFNTRSEIHLTFAKSSLIIAQKPLDRFATYSTSLQGKRAVVYSKDLVDEIIEYFDLDFDDRTALTFSKGEFELIGDTAIVRIQMK